MWYGSFYLVAAMEHQMSENYVVVSPVRNEAKYARVTLDSIVGQTRLPAKWVIVDDGSSDATPEILAEYSSKYPWIEIIRREDRGKRAVGPGVIEAFYAGLDTVNLDEYAFLCKLDLDLELPENYFQQLLERMTSDPKLGTCSGKAYIREGGRLIPERHGDDTSLGMTKFYRVSAFRDIGGFVRQVMWDGIDCHMCRMKGWRACSWDESNLRFVHLRPMGSSQTGILTGRARHGFGQYFMGTSLLYLLASALLRVADKPAVIGSLAIVWGWVRSAFRREPRFNDLEFRAFLRHYHWLVLLRGKRRALSIIEQDNSRL